MSTETNDEKLLVIASNNPHKIEEFKQLFPNYKVVAMREIGYNQDIPETGRTFLENSVIKAKTIHDYLERKGLKASVLADDSGLCVRALNGAPGLFSARYAGEECNSAKNRQKLLRKLGREADREAYFYCSIVEIFPNGKFIIGEGKTHGRITEREIGDTSFGYDCIFFSDELQKTFGQATHDEKNSVSHRARAIHNLKQKTTERQY